MVPTAGLASTIPAALGAVRNNWRARGPRWRAWSRAVAVALLVGGMLLGSGQALAAVYVLRQPTLFAAPLAAPRTPHMGLYMSFVEPLAAFHAALGARIPLVTWNVRSVTMQMGIDGGVWSSLWRDELLFHLINGDYLIGVPVMFAWNKLSGVVSFDHISAHLGDGATNGRRRINYSREYIAARLAYNFVVARYVDARVYTGGGVLVRTRPFNAGRLFGGGGFEAFGPTANSVRPLAALDVTYNQDSNSIDTAAQIGVAYHPAHAIHWTPRLVLSAYVGSDRRGQFLGEREKRVSIALILQQ